MDRFEQFCKYYLVKSYAKGEIILVEGEVPENAYVIKKGIVKMYSLTADGQEKPIAFDRKHEIFPVGWVFSRLQRSQYFHEAYTDCELYCIPREQLIDYLKNHTTSLFEFLDFFVIRYLNFQMRVNALEQSKASEKVINTLHYLSLRFGENVRPHMVKVKLPMTQQDLANFMGLTRETTGIELKKLERQGVIKYRRQTYIVNTNKLNDILDADYDEGKILGK